MPPARGVGPRYLLAGRDVNRDVRKFELTLLRGCLFANLINRAKVRTDSPERLANLNLSGSRGISESSKKEMRPSTVGSATAYPFADKACRPGFAAVSFGPNHVISGSRFSTNSRLPVWSIRVLQGPEPLQDGHYARFAAAKPTENGNLISLEQPLKKLEKPLKGRRET